MDKAIITEWLTDKNTCFLIGAGCSKCAGKPLMGELTEKVVAKLGEKSTRIMEAIIGPDGVSPPTVEDLTNQLLQLQHIAKQRKSKEVDGWKLEEIAEEIRLIQKSVVEVIGPDWKKSDYHHDFVQRVSSNGRHPKDFFLLNYDTLFEASIEELRYSYVDGFQGAENAHFDPSSFAASRANHFNVYKLHGSINWIREDDHTVRRRPLGVIAESDARSVIYPAEQKYIQTQYGVYEVLLGLFRERMRRAIPNNRLVVLGYSFSDEHINVAIEDGILAPGSNLTVFAFLGKSISEERRVQLRQMAKRCDNRLNIFISQEEYIGSLNGEECLAAMKEADYSRFENVVKLLTGKTYE